MRLYEMYEEFVPVGSGLPRSDSSKTGKPHLTEILEQLEKYMGWAPKNKFSDGWLTMEVGFWWEDTLSKVYGERSAAIRPGEVERDNIVGSPDGVGPDPGVALDPVRKDLIEAAEFEGVIDCWIDGKPYIISPDPNRLVLEEYKATWKSIKNKPTDNRRYMWQAMAYCYMMDLDTVVFRIAYLFGDWKGSGPIYQPYRIEFDADELESNWSMIVDFAKERGLLK